MPRMSSVTASSEVPLRRGARVLPRGPKDFVLQLALFMSVNVVHELTRGLSDGSIAQAFANGRMLVDWERSLGIFWELDVQRFALAHQWALDIANWTYFYAHFTVTFTFLFWLYLRRNEHYYFVRNVVFASNAVALIGYSLLPTAPPRMLTDLGFVDTLEKYASVSHASGAIATLANPFAAVPSVHTCYATIVGVTCVALVRWWALRLVWAVYPGVIVFSIVATANHFILDAVFGAATAAVAFVVAREIERRRATLPVPARRRLGLA
jgi:hypothetical protein